MKIFKTKKDTHSYPAAISQFLLNFCLLHIFKSDIGLKGLKALTKAYMQVMMNLDHLIKTNSVF